MSKEELELKLKESKELLDKAYKTTKDKHGISNANRAIILLFLSYNLTGFTRDNDSRKNVDKIYRDNYMLYQIMLDYAISSYIMNNMKSDDIRIKDIDKYACDFDGKLDYISDEKSTKIVALAVAQNVSYAYSLILLNRKLRESLLFNMINERYVQNKKEDLDNTKKSIRVKFLDNEKSFVMSKNVLNKEIFKMKQEEEAMDKVFKSTMKR